MEWTEVKAAALAWTESDNATPAFVSVVNAFIIMGDEGEAEKAEAGIRTTLKGQNGNPFGRQGVLATTEQNEIDAIINPFTDAVAAAFDADEKVANLLTPHGRSGKDAYANGAEFAATLRGRMLKVAHAAKRAGNFDSLC